MKMLFDDSSRKFDSCNYILRNEWGRNFVIRVDERVKSILLRYIYRSPSRLIYDLSIRKFFGHSVEKGVFISIQVSVL